MATLKNTRINDTGFLEIPAGTTAQRPSSPVKGMYRFNTTEGHKEYYDGSNWISAVYGKPSMDYLRIAGGGESSVDSTNLYLPYPSGIETGDFLIADGYIGTNVTASTPSGWDNTYNSAFRPCFTKIADGTESGSLTIQKNSTTTNSHGQIYLVRVPPLYTPYIVGVVGGFQTGGTVTLGTTVGNGFDLCFAGFGNLTGNASSVTGFTNLLSHSGWSGWYDVPRTTNVSFSSSGGVNVRLVKVNMS